MLLQIWKTQSCCSGVGPDLAYIEFSPRFFLILESSSLFRSQVSGALLIFHQQVFFLRSHQSGHFWNLITQFCVWFLAYQRGSILRYSSGLCISYPYQARFCTGRYDLLQHYLEYSSIACLQHHCSIFYTARREPSYELTREKKDTQAVVFISRVFFTDTNDSVHTHSFICSAVVLVLVHLNATSSIQQ